MSQFCELTPGCENYKERAGLPGCGTCNAAFRKAERMAEQSLLKQPKAIKRVADKLAALLRKYVAIKAKWLPGRMCCVFPERVATEVHHSAGRSPDEYYDEWAEQNDIPLLNDVRWWKAVSREGHQKIEMNPKWAKENGFSESRI